MYMYLCRLNAIMRSARDLARLAGAARRRRPAQERGNGTASASAIVPASQPATPSGWPAEPGNT